MKKLMIYYIQKYNSIEWGYNISVGGNGGNLGECVILYLVVYYF